MRLHERRTLWWVPFWEEHERNRPDSLWTERAIKTLAGGWMIKRRSGRPLSPRRLGELARFLRRRLERKKAGLMLKTRMVI